MNPIVIVGAGITGCVIAHGLSRRDYKVILIEKDAKIGGLAKTFRYGYGNFSFDIGPHRFFTQKEQIYNFIQSILKDEYVIISRKSEVYFLGKYYAWPLRPTTFFKLPLKMMLKSSWDLFLMGIKNKKKAIDNFEDYILANYGPSLYNAFFNDYSHKFLGMPLKEVHADWAREAMKKTIIDESIASRNLFDILKLFFIFKPQQTEFIYPMKGIGIFTERLTDKIKEWGGEIRTNSTITKIKCSSDTIDEICLQETRIKPEIIIWTGALGDICDLLDIPYAGLDYLSLLIFNIQINKPTDKIYQWCYYGSKDIIFSRVTIPQAFSKDAAPERKSSLCVEVACRENDPLWINPQRLIERVKKDLIKVGLIDRIGDIGDIHIERIYNAYPLYTLNYRQDLNRTKANLSKFKNLILAGRTGSFWYNNMDDSIENGLEVVNSILQELS